MPATLRILYYVKLDAQAGDFTLYASQALCRVVVRLPAFAAFDSTPRVFTACVWEDGGRHAGTCHFFSSALSAGLCIYRALAATRNFPRLVLPLRLPRRCWTRLCGRGWTDYTISTFFLRCGMPSLTCLLHHVCSGLTDT